MAFRFTRAEFARRKTTLSLVTQEIKFDPVFVPPNARGRASIIAETMSEAINIPDLDLVMR